MQKNKPVGHHEVDYLLTCGHVNAEQIEAALFIPKVGSPRTCTFCHTQQTIEKIYAPYWVDEDEKSQP